MHARLESMPELNASIIVLPTVCIYQIYDVEKLAEVVGDKKDTS